MPRVLWIDLCFHPPQRGLHEAAARAHRVLRIDQTAELARAIERFAPEVACVEFDYPDAHRLRSVTQLRRLLPPLPILMLTEHHSEALALWTFRTGVWDYRVKPIEHAVLLRCIAAAVQLARQHPNHCCASLPADLIEPAGHLVRPPTAAPRTSAALAWLFRHYNQPLRRDTLAALCHLSPAEFSRTFRRENGVTAESYLRDYRIAKARDLLTDPGIGIAATAYAVGFNDPSYFCRVFRRQVGVTARTYRQQVMLRPGFAGGPQPQAEPVAGAHVSCDRTQSSYDPA